MFIIYSISSITNMKSLTLGPYLASLSLGKNTEPKSWTVPTTRKSTSFNLGTLKDLKVLDR